MQYLLKHAKLTAFVAGAFSALGFAPYYYWPVMWLAFGLWFWLLLNSDSRKKSFAVGYWFGFSHFACSLSWIGNALLIEPDKFGWLYPLVLLGSGGFFGLFFAMPALVVAKINRPWQKWMALAAAFVIGEWVRSFIFTGFPWNLLGYVWALSDEFIQAAAWGGTYLLSLIAMLFFTAIGIYFKGKNKQTFVRVLIVVVSLSLFLWLSGYLRLKNSNIEETDTVVRIVQPSIKQQMKWQKEELENNFRQYLSLSTAESVKLPNIIVWGETASPFMLDVDDVHMNEAKKIIPQGAYLITGMISYQLRGDFYVPHNSMAVINDSGRVVEYYHKTHLVPFGEYIPLREYLPEFIKPVANAIGTFGKGEGPKNIKLPEMPSFSAIICYEAIFPHEILNDAEKPDFVVNLTNDGWYGVSSGPYQHWVATRLRAVEEGVAIIRAANNGISGMINAYGQVKKFLELNYSGFIDINLDKPMVEKTLYGKLGNWGIITFCLILFFLTGIKERGHR